MDDLEIKATPTNDPFDIERLLSSHPRQTPPGKSARRKPNRRSDKPCKRFYQQPQGLRRKHSRRQPQRQVWFWVCFIVVLIVIILAKI